MVCLFSANDFNRPWRPVKICASLTKLSENQLAVICIPTVFDNPPSALSNKPR